jgi:hypothetical protein
MINQSDPNLPVVFLACKVFEGIVSSPENAHTQYLDYGLHSIPNHLKQTIQEQINAIEEPSLIILGYGLCGNGLHEIEAGTHTLVIPKVDDCVSIFMGSRQSYLEQFHKNPGTYYLTKGWFEVGSDPLSEYEKNIEKFGQETTDWLMKEQYQHYKRLVFVALSKQDLEDYRQRAYQVAEYCQRFGMVYEEYIGSGEFINQIDQVLRSPEYPSTEFIVIRPGETLTQDRFF